MRSLAYCLTSTKARDGSAVVRDGRLGDDGDVSAARRKPGLEGPPRVGATPRPFTARGGARYWSHDQVYVVGKGRQQAARAESGRIHLVVEDGEGVGGAEDDAGEGDVEARGEEEGGGGQGCGGAAAAATAAEEATAGLSGGQGGPAQAAAEPTGPAEGTTAAEAGGAPPAEAGAAATAAPGAAAAPAAAAAADRPRPGAGAS